MKKNLLGAAALLMMALGANAQTPVRFFVNQVGYYPGEEKVIVVEGINENTKLTVTNDRGQKVLEPKVVRKAVSPWSNKTRYIVDVSSLKKPMHYKIATKGAKCGFQVTDHALHDKQAQASVAQARASVNRAKVNLGFCTITASVSGVIGEIPVRTGDQVSPGMQLTMLSGNTTMDAEISVTEALIESMVKEGVKKADLEKYLANMPPATFVMKNGTEYPHKGRVVSLTGIVNAATGSLTAKVSFPNPDGHLYSGIQGTVVINFAEKDVIVVPQNAVVRLQDKSQVYKVQADSTATAIEVTTEDTGNGKDFIITSGLNVGDQIVTTGANNVTEGLRVLFPEEVKSEK